jgi:hypothetical protein
LTFLITRTSNHGQARIFSETRIGFGQLAHVEAAAARIRNPADMPTGFAQADSIERLDRAGGSIGVS